MRDRAVAQLPIFVPAPAPRLAIRADAASGSQAGVVQRFDLARRTLDGEPIVIWERVSVTCK